jgi:GxxExxY protein|uniref:GxxExxY protein n=1 Tax=Cephaloticoccus sp. TaxID=1985742 RepID=UPI00404ABFB9
MTRINADIKMIYEELSGEIIGASMAVLNELGPGLDEKLYERALVIELRKRGHKVDQQKSYPVYYSQELIGNLVPDLIVDDIVIADPKVAEIFSETHLRQMLGYLAISKLKLALLLNFKHSKLEWKRVIHELKN